MTKKAPKFVQIACCTAANYDDPVLYALDEDGGVWYLQRCPDVWVKKTANRESASM